MSFNAFLFLFFYVVNVKFVFGQTTLTKPTPLLSDDQFGVTIAISDTMIIVGVPADNGPSHNMANSGTVYVYTLVGSDWGTPVELRPTQLLANDVYGLRVATSDTTVVVSAMLDDGLISANTVTNGGIIYVYNFTGSWGLPTELRPTQLLAGDQFGYDIAISGNRIVVSSPFDDGLLSADTLTDGGIVYVYTWSGSSWGTPVELRPPQLVASDNFGFSVALKGDRLAVSAYLDDGLLSAFTLRNTGIVYVYNWNGTSWGTPEELRPPQLVMDDTFGTDVAFSKSGNVLVISAPEDDGLLTANSFTNGGIVYVYRWNGTSWGTPTELRSPNIRSFDSFGHSIDINENQIVVGARLDDGLLTANTIADGGMLYLFSWDGTSWGTPFEMRPTDLEINDNFGNSVAISDSYIAVGAVYGTYSGLTDSGKVYLYSAPTRSPTLFPTTGTPTVAPTLSPTTKNPTASPTLAPTYECVSSSTCITGKFCNNGNACINQLTCSNTADCVNLLPGRIPRCIESKCVDKYAGTCVWGLDCETKSNLLFIYENSLGLSSKTFKTSDNTERINAAKDTVDEMKVNLQNPSSLDFVFTGSDKVIINARLFTLYNNNADIMAKMKLLVCGTSVYQCNIQLDTISNNRRLLTELGRDLSAGIFYSVTLSYVLDQGALANFDGTVFTNPAFVSQLAALLPGISTQNISLIYINGEMKVDVHVVVENVESETPLSPVIMSQLQSFQTQFTNITSLISTTLGWQSSDIISAAINLCGDRDCSGLGVNKCSKSTGICDCSGTNYWGINCETLCSCQSGGSCSKQYCTCEFPDYGQRCENQVAF